MIKKYKAVWGFLLVLAVIFVVTYLSRGNNVVVLNPKGWIASEQRDLMIISTLLMLVVVLPVFALTIHIAWKYRAGNKKARYTPDWDGDKRLESIWWGFPLFIILILSAITWDSSHKLDPFKPIEASAKPINIQVVALQWKWLFIYPEQDIATVNYIQIPEDTPINFEITADAPMNSFWIPQLGGQVYAMSGMKTQLHLIANNQGKYTGSSANLSGKGFAGMKFDVQSTSNNDYLSWVRSIKQTNSSLTDQEYKQLAQPSEKQAGTLYGHTQSNLFDRIISKYTEPSTLSSGQEHGAALSLPETAHNLMEHHH
jgi:cytochrome o ubiquinol oxidase subunit 2